MKKIHVQRVAQKKVLAYGKNIPAREILPKKNRVALNGPSLSINLPLCVLPKSVWERAWTLITQLKNLTIPERKKRVPAA